MLHTPRDVPFPRHRHAARGLTALASLVLVFLGVPGAAASSMQSRQGPPSQTAPPSLPRPAIDEGLFYVADGCRIGLRRRTDMIAVALRTANDGAGAAPDEVLARAMQRGGPLDGFAVHHTGADGLRVLRHDGAARDTSPRGLERFAARMREAIDSTQSLPGVAWAAPVLENAESGTLQVATDEVIVALKRPVDAAGFFRGDQRFASYRGLAGTDDQFIATLAGGVGEATVRLANALQDDARVAWAAPNFVQQFAR